MILPDLLAADLRVVICGTAVATASADRGHYYAGPGNVFWRYLYESGLIAERLSPDDDIRLPSLGIGLTDLVKNRAQSHDRGLVDDMPGLIARLTPLRPAWPAPPRGARRPAYGPQRWTLAGARVFVLPSTSGAGRRGPWDGRRLPESPNQIGWRGTGTRAGPVGLRLARSGRRVPRGLR